MSAGSTTDDLRGDLERGLAEIPVAATPDQLRALATLAELVARWAPRLNLTGHRDRATIQARLVLDAAALTSVLPPARSLADLGSGAGFPGFPIAILRPECRVTLVESRERRHHFQREALRTLGLENVTSRHGRAEAIPAEPQEAVIAQALARPEQAVRWMRRWARPGGWILVPGAERIPEVPGIEGISPEAPRRYRVPGGGPERTLWVARRSGD